MPLLPIDINGALFSNVKDVSRNVLAESRRDVLKDFSGSTYQRPGLVEFSSGMQGGCDGNFYWRSKDRVYSVFGGALYSIDQNGVNTQVASSVGLFNIGTPVVIKEASRPTRKLFMANGGRIVEFDGTTAQYLTDPEAPTQVTHPAILDTYLIANNLLEPERVEYSEVADPTSWIGEFVSAEGEPDSLRAIEVGWREITLFGESTIEHWYNDGVSPFSRLEGSMIQLGTLSPYSIVQADNGWFFLDSSRRIMKILGRQPQIISQPVNDVFGSIVDVSDAQGETITQNGCSLYLIRVGDRTLAFDYALNEWVSEWGNFSVAQDKYTRFIGQHFINVEPWNLTLCGDYTGDKLYSLDFDATQDNGEILRPAWRTGQIDHSTGVEKRSNELKIRLQRGDGTPGGEEPVMYVRWRDNGSKVWSNYREIHLGFTGDNDMYRSIFMLGSYRARQYEFSCTENVPITMVSVQEDVQLLSR